MSQNRYKGVTLKVQICFKFKKPQSRRFRNKYKYNSQIPSGEGVGLENKIWIKSSRLEAKQDSYILHLIGFLITPRKQN